MSANNSSGNPLCKCPSHTSAVMRTVAKEGPNKGRQFYTCAKSSCKFFEWVNSGSSTSTLSSNGNNSSTISNTNNTNTSGRSSIGSSSQPSISTLNQLNSPSKMMTAGQPSIVSNSVNTVSASGSSEESNLNIPCCVKHPTIKCKLLLVSKEGPNRGRLFWACGCTNPKEKCNHFKWFEGEIDQYKHLVPNYNSLGFTQSSKKINTFEPQRIKEESVPIFMSTSNSQNNWVANLATETFSEILSYLPVVPDCVRIQLVCVEWKRMADIFIANSVKYHRVELNLAFLKNDTPFSQFCEIFKKFYLVKQVTFCNLTIYSELMRLLEWVQVETLAFYNCKTIMSCDQNESVEEHVPSFYDYEDIDWQYVRENRGSLYSKDDIAQYKTKFAFRKNVTQMLFSGIEEDKEVLIADVNPKFIDDILQFATLDSYRKFVTCIKQKMGTNYVQGKRFQNLKRIISIDSPELNFSWVNKDRNVYYKVCQGLCNPGFSNFMTTTQEKAIIKEDDQKVEPIRIPNLIALDVDTSKFDWYYKNFMVQDRSIAVIVIPFTNSSAKIQIYNGASCSFKTVVEANPRLSPTHICEILKALQIIHYVQKDAFKTKDLSLLPYGRDLTFIQYGLVLGSLNLQDTYPRKTILEKYLHSALLLSRKMVSADLDELKSFCNRESIQKAIKLLFFLHRETDLMHNYQIPSKVMHVIKSIDGLWFNKEEFINDDDEDNDTPSIHTITATVTVSGEQVRIPFSWYHLVNTGKIKHIFELTEEESARNGDSSTIEQDEDDEEEEDDSDYEANDGFLDISSEDGNEPEEDDDYNEESEEEDSPEEESEYDSEDDSKKRKKNTRATRSKKRKY